MTARQGAQAALGLGLFASLAGNALAAEPTGLGRLVASWAPLALAVVVWLVEHHRPAPGPWRAATWLGTAVVASVAAWVSYWHLVELARMAGEEGIAAHLLPLSVDGLVIVASAYLRDTDTRPAPKARKVAPATAPAPSSPAPAPTAAATPRAVTPARSTATTSAGTEGEGRRGPRDTASEIRRLAGEHPEWTQAQVAEAAGCSVRTVRRHLSADLANDLDALLDQLTSPAAEPATNGARP